MSPIVPGERYPGPVVLGIDTSTQSCTIEIRTADEGRLLGGGRAKHPATHPPRSEQDPHSWWSAFRSAYAQAIDVSAVDPRQVSAISVAGQCHGLVMLGADQRVLRPVKLWNDTESAPQARAMVADYGTEAWVRAIGVRPTAALTITKLAWVAEHEPHLLDELATVVLPHDWMTAQLTGRFVTDRSEASGTGYYSAKDAAWRVDLLERYVSPNVEWESMFPTVLGPNDVAGVVRPEIAAELGLRDDVLVGAGGGDQHLGAVGLGLQESQVVYSLGTSGVVAATTPDPVEDLSGFVDGVANATGGYLPLTCTLNCAKVTDSFAYWLGVDLDQLASLALSADLTQDRPTLVAYLDGERVPPRPGTRGLLADLTSSVTRESLALSAFEGVISGLVRGHEAIAQAGVAATGDVFVAGGAARSPGYRQLLADMLGRPVRTRRAAEITARGACVQAASVLSGTDISTVRDQWCPAEDSVHEPRPGATQGIRERYLQLADLSDDVLAGPAK